MLDLTTKIGEKYMHYERVVSTNPKELTEDEIVYKNLLDSFCGSNTHGEPLSHIRWKCNVEMDLRNLKKLITSLSPAPAPAETAAPSPAAAKV